MAPPPRYPHTEARREEVGRWLAAHGRLSQAQRRELASRFACTPAVIAHDLAMLQRGATSVPAVLPVVSTIAPADERDTALLRALGRLEVMTSAQIKALLYPDTTLPTMRSHLRRLLAANQIWQTTTTMPTVAPPEAGFRRRQPPPKAPYVYGLTTTGKATLEALEAEPHEPSLALLRARDRRDGDIPRQQLTHDLLASSWCCSVIDAARRCPLLVDIHCQVEYVSAYDERGRARQRFDAYMALRFTRQQRRQNRPGWWLPWYDGDPDTDGHVTVRFALEVDRGTEQLKVLLGKAYMYATLTASGHYTEALGGPVLPVVLAPPGQRAAQIAREWQAGWPGGRGVISTPAKASHPQHGALWGEYFTLADDPARPTRLLSELVPSLEAWAALTRDWMPGVPLKV